jgi:PIN domain nuclease of toxin-antitoxin system
MGSQSVIVLDTHVLVWWVPGERRKLSRKAAQALQQHGKRNELLVSSISFFEIATLERRGRLRFSMAVTTRLANARRLPEYRLEPLTDDIAERAGQFGDASSLAIPRTR